MQETLVRSLHLEDLLQEGMATTPIFLPGESHGERSLVGYSPQGCKESDMTETTDLSGTQYMGETPHPFPKWLKLSP